MSEEIPTTTHLAAGTLEESGVKYYMCENDNPSDSIVLMLVVHVGSLMEDDSEQGLSHFIEHLGFKSTKSFEHYELVKFLESLGISYGPDLNASTHLLETVFRLNIKYDEDCSQLAMGINVLSEWAYHMNISEKDVAEERHVIAAEYMAKQGLGNRLLKHYWKAIFDSSQSSSQTESSPLLSRRFPIGIPDVFMHCDHNTIRQFYEKWYRPENMSVLVCGAVHGKQQQVLALLEKCFRRPTSPLPVPVTPITATATATTRCQQLQQRYLSLPTHHAEQRRDVVVAMVDPDLSCTQICFEFFSPICKSRTTRFIREDILRRLMSSILDKRFNELHKSRGSIPSDVITLPRESGDSPLPPASLSPFLSVQVSIREFVRGLVCIGVSATLKDVVVSSENDSATLPISTLEVAVQSLLLEMKRLRLLGVNPVELATAKGKWKKHFSHQLNKTHVDNEYMASELQSYVLSGENIPLASPAEEAGMCIDAVDDISVAEMDEYLSLTFDMDVEESKSQYYEAEGEGEARCSFRALSGQFARPSAGASGGGEGESQSESESLRCVLAAARHRVAGLGCGGLLETWPCREQIEESTVLAFAQAALAEAEGVAPASVLETAVLESTVSSLECSEFVLPNGVTVCCKWMLQQSLGKVSMQGFALGGSSELSPELDLLMFGLDDMAGHSDSRTASGETLLGKDILELQSVSHTRVNTQRHQHHRGIGGSAPSDKLELLLALLVIKMTSQCIDRTHFDDWIHKKKSQLVNQANSPEFLFMDRSRILACGDEPNFRPISPSLLQSAGDSYDVTTDLYARAFLADPTEFTFVFTGDIGDKGAFKSLLVKYLGKLKPRQSTIGRCGRWLSSPVIASPRSADASGLFPFTLLSSSRKRVDGPVEESLCLLSEDDNKASMMLIFRADMLSFLCDDADLLFALSLDAACRVLQLRLLDELRIKLGKVYNVSVEKSRSSLCTFFLISIGLHCQPADIDVIKHAIRDVVRGLQEAGPEDSELKCVTEAMSKVHGDAASNSSYWLFWILDSYKAYRLHQWRCARHPDRFQPQESCEWLGRNGLLRANGRVQSIKEEVSSAALRDIYASIFDEKKCITMHLRPMEKSKKRGGEE